MTSLKLEEEPGRIATVFHREAVEADGRGRRTVAVRLGQCRERCLVRQPNLCGKRWVMLSCLAWPDECDVLGPGETPQRERRRSDPASLLAFFAERGTTLAHDVIEHTLAVLGYEGIK